MTKALIGCDADIVSWVDRQIEEQIDARRLELEAAGDLDPGEVLIHLAFLREHLRPGRLRAIEMGRQMLADAGGAPITARTEIRNAKPEEQPRGKLH